MSKAMKNDVKEVFKWTEVLRKNLVETCLEAQARGNFTDSGFKSAEKFRRNLIPFQVK